MTTELEYKHEVEVERRDKSIRFDAVTKDILREAGMMNKSKLKIPGVSPKMLKNMKMEFVQCPVLDDEIPFVRCFVCPNFQSRVSKVVLCRGDPLPEAFSATSKKAKAPKKPQQKPPAPDKTKPDSGADAGATRSVKPQSKSKDVRREEIGITEPKAGNFSEWYTQVVLKAQLADYSPVKGMIAVRPDGYAIWESIKAALDERFAGHGVRNAFMPVLIPESLLTREKTHFEGFNPEVFWVTHSGDTPVGDRLALRPTSETIAYSLYSKWIKSWRDLPLKLNFWNTALRAEIKSTKPFLRTSEFLWQEGHTAHAAREEAVEQVVAILETYRSVMEEHLAIPVWVGQKSAKEQFVGAEYTLTLESMMPDGRALQMGTSHMLGQNFAKPFSVKYADSDNVERHVWQTSWGVSWRLMGALVMVHGDDRGLVLPPRVAPVQVVIIPVHSKPGDEVHQAASSLAQRLAAAGCRVHTDDRDNVTTGYKYGDWEMRGVPLRIELGPRDLKDGSAVLVRRDTLSKETADMADIDGAVPAMLDSIQDDMFKSACKRQGRLIHGTDAYDALAERLAGPGGFVQTGWCGDQKCEDAIKEDTGADIRLINDDYEDHPQCVVCGSSSKFFALVARGY